MPRTERLIYLFLTYLMAACSGPLGELPADLLEFGDPEFLDPHEHEEYDDFAIGLGATEVRQGLAHAGRWQLPSELVPVSDSQNVAYDGAPPFNGGANCAPGATAGARTLRDHLLGYFPQISGIGIYNCRVIAGTNSMSLHGVGRALDIMIPTAGGDADNDAGDPIAHYLIENAEAIGIQQIIWDHSIWRSYGSPRHKVLNSSNPHIDHLHVEINEEGASEATPWFGAPQGPSPCDPLSGTSGVVDNGHRCLSLFGPGQYWRTENGVGHGGNLRWTNAFDGSRASNWAKWSLPFESSGQYQIEVFLDESFARFDRTRYEIRANGATFPVVMNQAQASGWTSLGTFHFAGDGSEHVTVYDNAPAPVASNQHIAVDALRYTLVASQPTPMTSEETPRCDPLPPVGGIIEETGPCFDMFGPAAYWRSVGDAGHGNHLLWTNAFQNETPSNWAQWRLPLTESGDYQIRLYVEPAYAQFIATRYELNRGDDNRVLLVDQSSANGWYSVGTFSFDAATENTLTVFDHAGIAVGSDRRIVVDAIQLVRLSTSSSSGVPGSESNADTHNEEGSTGGGRADAAGNIRYPELHCFGLRCDTTPNEQEPIVVGENADEGYDEDDFVPLVNEPDANGFACTQSGPLPAWGGLLGLGLWLYRCRRRLRRAGCAPNAA